MIKVAIICTFSNQSVRERLTYKIPWWEKLGKRLMGKKVNPTTDLAIWISNAIHEFEKRTKDVDLHVIAPAEFIDKDTKFELNGIHYFFFNDEQTTLRGRLSKVLKLKSGRQFLRNRDRIMKYLVVIQPQIVHVVGAENPQYSLSLLDIPSHTPTILSLQTLLSDDVFLNNYPISRDRYDYLHSVEISLLKKTDYIASGAEKYRKIVREIIPDAKILSFPLPLAETVNHEVVQKRYDFVYFARNISKAVADAIECFALAYNENPSITLDIIGEYSLSEKNNLDNRIKELSIQDNVFFEGLLPTHDDVIKQMRKSRIALLPVRVDLIPGTIREAMANGLPVLTTDTGELGTQRLNTDAECALITPIGDYKLMAANMIRILNDSDLEDALKTNGYNRAEKLNSNRVIVGDWIDAYYNIVNQKSN